MDVVLLVYIALLLAAVIIAITVFLRRSSKKKKQDGNDAEVARVPAIRRAAAVRGMRQRRSRVTASAIGNEQHHEAGGNDDIDETRSTESVDLSKIGAKKRAKLEAKAERKVQREIEEREREDRKKREQRLQEERDKQSAREQEDERRREEVEKLLREEKERREQEEYLKLKQEFSVDEEGFEEKVNDEPKNLLQEFVEYVKSNKVVILEDLAQHFGLKTTNVIERVQQMQTDGILSGVIDDRGKFIYISHQELEAVAKFVKQRGRISIAELAEHSNDLINLKSGSPCSVIEA